MDERVAIFNRQFGARIMSKYKLRRIYKELGIKRNKLRLTKVMNDQTRSRVKNYLSDLSNYLPDYFGYLGMIILLPMLVGVII